MSSSGNRVRTIYKGRLQRTSPTAILLFDSLDDPKGPNSGCERKWGFRYISRIEAPKTKSQQAGIDGHERLEHYEKTGELVLTEIELAGKLWIPRWPEDIAQSRFETGPDLENYTVKIADVPVVAKLDWLNCTGSFVDIFGDRRQELIPEVVDYKFSGAKDPRQRACSPNQLGKSLPMAVYGTWVPQYLNQRFDRVRLSHLTFSTQKRDAFKRTTLSTIDSLRARIADYEPVVERMKVAASTTDPNELKPNFEACERYGGCPYKEHCVRSVDDQMRSFLSPGAYERLNQPERKGLENMSILDSLAAGQQPAATPAQPTADPAMAARLAALQAAEAPAAAPTEAPPVEHTYSRIDWLLKTIKLFGLGQPMLSGEVAQAVAFMNKWDLASGGGYAGTDKLASVNVSTPAQLEELYQNCLAWKRDQEAKAPPAPVAAPPAPVAAPPAPVAAPPAPVQMPSLVPPDAPAPSLGAAATPLAPEVALSLPPSIADVAQTQATAAAAEPKPEKRSSKNSIASDESNRVTSPDTGRVKWKESCQAAEQELAALKLRIAEGGGNAGPDPRIAQLEAQLTEAQNALAAAQNAAATQGISTSPAPISGIELYVDCMPEGKVPCSALPLMDQALAAMSKSSGLPHFLMSSDDNYGYGKWEGVLRGMFLEPQRLPPAGCYYLHNVRGNKLAEAFVDALRPHCATFVRGF